MEIKVPNLVSESALAFCAELEQIVDIEDDACYVDFQNLNTCDPFPMLLDAKENSLSVVNFMHEILTILMLHI